ncbi:unnamed protein product [[Candida] boidinii]|nr:unnamed protein product [[Candida] boidinii]
MNCESENANKLVSFLESKISNPKEFIGSTIDSAKVIEADNFSYTDLDGSVSTKQGLYVKLDSGLRFIVRLSGTGSSGATIRLYLEKHSSDKSDENLSLSVDEFLKDDIKSVVSFLNFKEFIGREEPDVRT